MPSPSLYFEDFYVGQEFDLGSYVVSAEEIHEFALQWDMQPFHVDPELAARTHFGEPIASGWHTTAVFQRLHVQGLLLDSAVIVGRNIDGLRWFVPVKGGDELTGRIVVRAVEPSPKRPQGVVSKEGSLTNQRGEQVMSMVLNTIVAARIVPEPDGGPESASGLS